MSSKDIDPRDPNHETLQEFVDRKKGKAPKPTPLTNMCSPKKAITTIVNLIPKLKTN
jgi:hypothetical protein